MPQLFHVDHYDAYTYTVVAPISFVASLLFVLVTLSIKEARKFPGNLLIVISVAEAALCLHWFLIGLQTQYILGVNEPEPDDLSCKINSVVAVFCALCELFFHFSFLVSIIVMFRNTMKKVKFLSLFWVLPAAGAVVGTIGAVAMDSLGKNIYGHCSLKESSKSGYGYLAINGSFVFMSLWAIKKVSVFRKRMKKAGRGNDEFYNFYLNYISLVSFFYLVIGILYYVGHSISECLPELPKHGLVRPEDLECVEKYYLSRILNNIKVFVPLISLVFRLRDPFLQRLVQEFFERRKQIRASQTSQGSALFESSIEMADDFALNNKVKEVRQMVARTLLVGVYKYYEGWVQKYRNSGDETVSNRIENHLSPIDEPNLIPPSDRDISLQQSKGPDRYYEAFIRSYEAKRFIEIIGWDKLTDIFRSFEVGSNLETIKKSEEQSGGAGGEFFLCTFDKKYFIKTMTKKELATFRGVIEDYAAHLTSGEGSFITKIVGVFSFRFAEGVKKTRLFVMENVFGTEKPLISRVYDLKGSVYNRQVLIQSREQLLRLKSSKIKETLKDIDFNNLDSCFHMTPEDRQYILGLIERDVRFFKEAGLIDYSLLLGVIEVGNLSHEDMSRLEALATVKRAFYTQDRTMCLIPGIIDFFQLYTWGKRMEKYFKKAKKMKWGLDTSAQAPGYYGDRFVSYMKVVFS